MVFLDVGHELIGNRPIDEPMVVAERQIRHRPDANRIVDDDRTLLDSANTEDRHLRLVDDWHTELGAEPTRIGNGNVPPWTSSGFSCLVRARSATSAIARSPSVFISSACSPPER